MCLDINALCLIDDSLRYAIDCAGRGIPTIIFGHYPWNEGIAPSLATRAFTWSEVYTTVMSAVKQPKEQMIPETFSSKLCISYTEQVEKLSISPGCSSELTGSLPLIAAIQLCSTHDKESNFVTCERLIRAAASKGARLICLPECCMFIGCSAEQTIEAAEALAGPTIAKYQELAASLSVCKYLFCRTFSKMFNVISIKR